MKFTKLMKYIYTLFTSIWIGMLMWSNQSYAYTDTLRNSNIQYQFSDQDVAKAVKALNAKIKANRLYDENDFIVDWRQDKDFTGDTEMPPTLLPEASSKINEILKNLKGKDKKSSINFYVLISPPLLESSNKELLKADYNEYKQRLLAFTRKVFLKSDLNEQNVQDLQTSYKKGNGFLLNIDGIVTMLDKNKFEGEEVGVEWYYPSVAFGRRISIESARRAIDSLKVKGLDESFGAVDEKRGQVIKTLLKNGKYYLSNREGISKRALTYVKTFSRSLILLGNDIVNPDNTKGKFITKLTQIKGDLGKYFRTALKNATENPKSFTDDNLVVDDYAGIFPNKEDFTFQKLESHITYKIITTSDESLINENTIIKYPTLKNKTAYQIAYERAYANPSPNVVYIAIHIENYSDKNKKEKSPKVHFTVIPSKDLQGVISFKAIGDIWKNYDHWILKLNRGFKKITFGVLEYLRLVDLYVKIIIEHGIKKENVEKLDPLSSSVAGFISGMIKTTLAIKNDGSNEEEAKKKLRELYTQDNVLLKTGLMTLNYFLPEKLNINKGIKEDVV